MSIKHELKMFYLKRIKNKSDEDIRIDHLRKIGTIVGEDCWIYSDKVETSEPYLVKIGNHVMISADVRFVTHDAALGMHLKEASDSFGQIIIGDNCFIGIGSIIMAGVSIADNCIVGAGSLVTKSVTSPGMVLAGNPAKIIGTVENYVNKNKPYALCTYNMSFDEKKSYILKNHNRLKHNTNTNF